LYVRGLELVDFRSYTRVVVELEPGPCVLVGPNGVGKTNLVEALAYVATLGSHRVATDAPLVRFGASRAVVRCAIIHDERELLVELSIEPGKANKARLGRANVTRARDILGALKLVLFAPEDLTLVRGDPAERRRYLDDLLVSRQPRFAGVRSDYDRVLKQRNALLRSSYLARKTGGNRGGDLSTLDVWDTHLAQHGAKLLAARLELTEALAPHVAGAYDAVSAGRSDARITYSPSWRAQGDTRESGLKEIEAALSAALTEARPSEVERGVTLVGPHRDDLVLTLGELPAKGYASHGESWSFALALRLASYDLLRADGIEPVLVLDDVFAELDAGRRDRLAELVRTASQVIVTCAVDADVPRALRGARYEVGGGEVSRVG
jgi:DNA replication and repair protein RecF